MMKSVRACAAAMILAGLPLGALAHADVPPPPVAPEVAVAADLAAVDPARLAAARITIDHIFPAGTYAKLLGGSMQKMMDAMMDSMGQMPIQNIVAMIGGTPADAPKLSKSTMNDLMKIVDPAYGERMKIVTRVMLQEMGGMMNQFEPDLRDGMAHAYAARFTVAQLDDMNRFFATPSGDAYASNAMLLQMDPAVMSKMQAFMPLLMKAMPGIMSKVAEATASLPKPRQWTDLTPAELDHVADVLGLPKEKLAKEKLAGTKNAKH